MEEKNLEKIESKPAFRHSIPVQMRFNDIDVLGHVNNSVFSPITTSVNRLISPPSAKVR